MSKTYDDTTRRVMRPREFAIRYKIGLSSFWRHVKHDAEFPKPFKLTPRCTVVDFEEAERWYEKRRNQRSGGNA